MKAALFVTLALPVFLSGCVTYNVREAAGFARFGQTVEVGPVEVTPLAVLEDSRCPAGVQCAWAGRVRIDVRVNNERQELTLGQPVAISGGNLTLSEVRPPKREEVTVGPTDYRFRFDFR